MNGLQASHVVAGFIATLIGYTSSVAIVYQAAQSAGATPEQVNSWILMLGGGVGFLSMALSIWYKIPLLMAWSTPGAVVLITSLPGVTMAEAIGAFLVSAVLIFLTGISGLFSRITELIPRSLAAALLAGVLLDFCLDAFSQFEHAPLLVGGMLLSYVFGIILIPRYTIPITFMIGVLIAGVLGLFKPELIQLSLAKPVWTTPEFTIDATFGIALPLFVITMTTQNLPGVAVLRTLNYQVPVSNVISWSGLVTLILAPFGAFAINMAAITASICASRESGEVPAHRYWAAVSGGMFYLMAAFGGVTIVSLLSASPSAFVLALAGIALIGTLSNALGESFRAENERLAVALTLLIAASGITILGISSAFWSIVVGVIVWKLTRRAHA